MKTLIIEWKHLDVEGETCDRCYDTGENLDNEVKRLNRAFEPQGIHIEIKDTLLDKNQVSQSNSLLFDGIPIEELLDIEIADNYCASCSDLIGEATSCRTVKYEDQEYEDIPAKAIRRAVHKALGVHFEEMKGKPESTKSCCYDDGNQGCCGNAQRE